MGCGDHINGDLVISASGTGAADITYTPFGPNAETYHDVSRYDTIHAQLNASEPTGSPTTPTLDVLIEGSFDKSNWFTVLTFTQLTTSAGVERKGLLKTTTAFIGRYLRAKSSVGTAAGTAAYAHTVSIQLT